MEVLVAAVILAGGAALALAGISASLDLAAHTHSRLAAQRLAAEGLARAAAGDIKAFPVTERVTQGPITYTWRVDRHSEGGRLGRLICKVEWDRRGRPQTLRLERLAVMEGPTP